MRYIVVLVLLVFAGVALGQQLNDPPDTSHTNSGSAYFDKQHRLHVRPAYTVDTETPEQHAAARKAHDAAADNLAAQSIPDQAPPLAVRLQMYEQLSYMTPRDFAGLTPQQQAQVICDMAAEKIDIQLEYERHGSHGVYNMDALRHAGPYNCRKYLDSIH